jgi:hypothetical protein
MSRVCVRFIGPEVRISQGPWVVPRAFVCPLEETQSDEKADSEYSQR